MPNYDASAELYRIQMTTVKLGYPKIRSAAHHVHHGKYSDLVKKVMAEPLSDAQCYEITTGLEAGFQQTLFQYRDIVEVYNRTDFPR
jgi:hypothetical protein